ncbi:MAG: hypothetical protein HY424_01525 [Candidatus Levybacteria bacterium]|nr:hypothetical protein [Candidatus Levybacteria bacterium]
MKKPVFIITLLIGIIVVLSIIKVILYNRLSTSGVFVGKVEEEIISYKTQNAILSEKLLILSSLTNISEKATKLGFIKDNSLIILKTSRPLAIKQ